MMPSCPAHGQNDPEAQKIAHGRPGRTWCEATAPALPMSAMPGSNADR